MNKEQIEELIETYGFEEILARFNLTPWKVLELLDDTGYIMLEYLESEND
jgi:ADP-dependent phosphofructokinase/glucokinase